MGKKTIVTILVVFSNAKATLNASGCTKVGAERKKRKTLSSHILLLKLKSAVFVNKR